MTFTMTGHRSKFSAKAGGSLTQLLRSLLLAVVAVCATFFAQTANAQGIATSTYNSATSGSFTAGSVTTTVAVDNYSNATAVSGVMTGTWSGSWTNFPSTWYTLPTTLTGNDFRGFQLIQQSTGSNASMRVTFTFNRPVTNPVLHFFNIDGARYDFGATRDSANNTITITKLSGNGELELSSLVVNSANNGAVNDGCEAGSTNSGANGNGGCGSVRVQRHVHLHCCNGQRDQ